jgi:hypothetical protein
MRWFVEKALEVGEITEDVAMIAASFVRELLQGELATAAELVRGIGR